MTRAERRHHNQRVAANRRRFTRHLSTPEYWASLSDNQLATRHPLDCGSRCYLCHSAKLTEPRRAREKREWMREAS